MESFGYYRGKLHCEKAPVEGIASALGTPFYLYSQSGLERGFRAFDEAFGSFPHLTCFAVKANSNLAVLGLFRRLGAGFDIVSGGELLRALRAGADPGRIVFSGVGKSSEEIDLALAHDILQFNVESEAELRLLDARALTAGRVARISLRVNPDVDAGTHPYIATGLRESKFGVPIDDAPALCRRARRSRRLEVAGMGFHIGSQITSLSPIVDALVRLREAALGLRGMGFDLRHLDLGGGLGIRYKDETPPTPEAYARAVLGIVGDAGFKLLLEPGRVLVGNAGALITRVLRTKRNGGRRFIVVDAAMNDLIRPSLYGAFHAIRPVSRRGGTGMVADVVGPVCETGDFLARDREVPRLREGDLIAVMSAGAYAFAGSSNYNSRPRAAEVLVRGERFKVVRRRETFRDLIRGESANPL